MFCPQCRAEYVEGVVTCAECGVPLVETLREEPRREEVEFVGILATESLADVTIIRSILEGSGIEYYFVGGIKSVGDPMRLMVLKEQEADARELLKDLKLAFYSYLPDRRTETGGGEEG
jgi:hypothetical protein